MIAVIIGPPGAGKSKQSELLKNREHIRWLYVGQLLRNQDNPDIDQYLAAGKLVPDDMVNQLVAKAIEAVDADRVVVVDGFPRHLPQAEWLVAYAARSKHALAAIIHLMVPTNVSLERLAARGREDDKPEVIRERLAEYEQNIAPVVGYFERSGVSIHPVDGNREVEAVFSDIDRILNDVHQG